MALTLFPEEAFELRITVPSKAVISLDKGPPLQAKEW